MTCRRPLSAERAERRGIASIWVLVVLSLLATFMATTTWQFLAGRRVLRERHQRLQADCLARSGIELAASRLLADAKEYTEGPVEIVPDSQLSVQVKATETPHVFHVTSVAHYPTNSGPKVVVRSVERTFRRVADKESVRLEVVASAKPTP